MTEANTPVRMMPPTAAAAIAALTAFIVKYLSSKGGARVFFE
jgi:hypothetical protein